MPQSLELKDEPPNDDAGLLYDSSLGDELRAIRRRRRRFLLELVFTVVAALTVGAVCGLILAWR
jgi:hypothetical protein